MTFVKWWANYSQNNKSKIDMALDAWSAAMQNCKPITAEQVYEVEKKFRGVVFIYAREKAKAMANELNRRE